MAAVSLRSHTKMHTTPRIQSASPVSRRQGVRSPRSCSYEGVQVPDAGCLELCILGLNSVRNAKQEDCGLANSTVSRPAWDEVNFRSVGITRTEQMRHLTSDVVQVPASSDYLKDRRPVSRDGVLFGSPRHGIATSLARAGCLVHGYPGRRMIVKVLGQALGLT